MNLAYKKILGKFTKVLGFGKTPPHVGKNSQIILFFFERAYLTFTKLFINLSMTINGSFEELVLIRLYFVHV